MSQRIRHPPNCMPSPSTSSGSGRYSSEDDSGEDDKIRQTGTKKTSPSSSTPPRNVAGLKRTIGTSSPSRRRSPAITPAYSSQRRRQASPDKRVDRSTVDSLSKQLEEKVALIEKLQKQQNMIPKTSTSKLVPRNRPQGSSSPTKLLLQTSQPRRRLSASEMGKIEVANVSRVEIGQSKKKNKRLDAKFHFLVSPFPTGKLHLVVSFGSSHGKTFLDHNAETIKQQYLDRYAKTQNWNDPFTAGALARYLLYGETTLQASIAKFQRKFGFRQVVAV